MGLSRSWVSAITVEPCMFFFSLCNGMFVIIAQNLYIAKADMLAVFDATTALIEIGIIVNKLSPLITNCRRWRQLGVWLLSNIVKHHLHVCQGVRGEPGLQQDHLRQHHHAQGSPGWGAEICLRTSSIQWNSSGIWYTFLKRRGSRLMYQLCISICRRYPRSSTPCSRVPGRTPTAGGSSWSAPASDTSSTTSSSSWTPTG